MNTMTLNDLSIIIPNYNSSNFLFDLLKSWKNYLDDLEVIVVDDGSNEENKLLLKKIGKMFPQLVIYFQENQGVSSARNKGIELSSKKYLFFVDADDNVNFDELKKVMEQYNDEDLLIFGLIDRFIYSNKTVDKESKTYLINQNKLEFLLDFGKYLNDSILYSPCNKIYKKELIEKNNISFEVGLPLGEDLLFNLQYFSKINNVKFSNNYIYIYNHFYNRKETGSTKYYDNQIELISLTLNKIEDFLKNEDVFEENLNALNVFYIKRMNYLISNLLSKTCKLNKKEKKTEIKKIVTLPIFHESLYSKEKGLGPKDKVLKFIYKNEMISIIYLLFSILS